MWAETAAHVPYEKLTQIYYAFLIPTPSGGFEPVANPALLKDLVTRSHAADVKVSVAIGGGRPKMAEVFAQLAATPETRAAFIQNLLVFIDEHQLDGADIDWEYPVVGVSDEHCALLMAELSAAFRPRGLLLSIAVPGRDFKLNYPSSIFDTVDYLNVMSYDQGRRHDHSTMEYARLSLDYWTGRGCPPEKMVLGVPFYGRSTTAEPVSYRRLRERGADPAADTFTDTDGHLFGYNGHATLRAKTDLARERGLAGLMIWNLDHDTQGPDSLLGVLHEALPNVK